MRPIPPANPLPIAHPQPRKSKRVRRVLIGLGLTVLVLLLAAEVALRYAGWVDFPLYSRDPRFGYFPAPQQSGHFRNRKHWVFNDQGLGVAAAWQPSDRADILLVGNSIVSGGNAYDQPEKLAPRLQVKLGEHCAVWPVASGAWTTVNAVRYLEAHPDLVAKSDFFIWEFMSHQMDHANPWVTELRHPTRRPVWALGYVLRKLVSERFGVSNEPVAEPATNTGKNYDDFERLVQQLAPASRQSPRGIILAYPTLTQWRLSREGRDWLPDRQRLERLAKTHDLLLLDLAKLPAWTEEVYWDQVHLSPFGNAVLASQLGHIVSERAPFLNCSPRPH